MRSKKAQEKREDAPIAIDLFAGAGGLSEGFRQAGFKVAAAVDFDGPSCETHKLNHPDTEVLQADVHDVRGADLRKLLQGRKLDVLIGGPSCQGFSTHGKRRPDDPRNFLFREYLRLVEELDPPWVMMENVTGLLTYGQGMFKAQIEEGLKRLGYQSEMRILNAADYGVPQLRRRVIFMATRTGRALPFPTPTHGPGGGDLLSRPYVTVDEAIGDLPLLGDEGGADELPYSSEARTDYQREMRRGSSTLRHHEASRISDLAMSIMRKIPEGRGLRHLSPEEMPDRFKKMRTISTGALRRDCTTLYYRLSRKAPAYTITCFFRNVSSGAFTHPLANRALTPREAARLMSFPDRFVFSATQRAKQIGNAVPPILARAVAAEIREVILETGSRRDRSTVSAA